MQLYLSGSLDGRTKQEIEKEHRPVRKAVLKMNWKFFDPFLKERRMISHIVTVDRTRMLMEEIVHIDKVAIKDSDILLVLTGDISSKGTFLEIGYARYHLVMPVVAIAPIHAAGRHTSWLSTEVDYVARDYKESLKMIDLKWGTPEKRLIWRCSILAEHKRHVEVKESLEKYFKVQ